MIHNSTHRGTTPHHAWPHVAVVKANTFPVSRSSSPPGDCRARRPAPRASRPPNSHHLAVSQSERTGRSGGSVRGADRGVLVSVACVGGGKDEKDIAGPDSTGEQPLAGMECFGQFAKIHESDGDVEVFPFGADPGCCSSRSLLRQLQNPLCVPHPRWHKHPTSLFHDFHVFTQATLLAANSIPMPTTVAPALPTVALDCRHASTMSEVTPSGSRRLGCCSSSITRTSPRTTTCGRRAFDAKLPGAGCVREGWLRCTVGRSAGLAGKDYCSSLMFTNVQHPFGRFDLEPRVEGRDPADVPSFFPSFSKSELLGVMFCFCWSQNTKQDHPKDLHLTIIPQFHPIASGRRPFGPVWAACAMSEL